MATSKPAFPDTHPMSPQEFIANFVVPAISDYAKQSSRAKRKWQWFRMLQYIFVSLTPLVSLILPFLGGTSDQAIHFTTAASGFLAALFTFMVTNGNYQQNWVQYEVTSVAVKTELALFDAQASPYDTADAYKAFATSFDKILSKEVAQWAQQSIGAGAAARDQGQH